ncbi:hypothetical protein M8J76_010022 [Diaphorina citri]|nr:hypothetical protein M8J75_014221 [Diaphorina citri]KAI5745313.1 hypothetical protein M8J76_010022 [Diaphorina citri]
MPSTSTLTPSYCILFGQNKITNPHMRLCIISHAVAMFILNHFPVLTSSSSRSCSSVVNFGVVLKCVVLLLLISLSSEQERHNNDSLQIYLPKPASNVHNSYSLISSFTKLLPKTSNKTSAKNVSLSGDATQAQEKISASYYVLTKPDSISTSPTSGIVSDYLTNTNLMGSHDTSSSPDHTDPANSNNNTSISIQHTNDILPSEPRLYVGKPVYSTQHVMNTRKESDKQTPVSSPNNISAEMTTGIYSPNIFKYFPELNASQELYNPSIIDYKLLTEYNSSNGYFGNNTLYPDEPGNIFNTSNTTLVEEPLADVILLGGLSVLLGVMILVTVIGQTNMQFPKDNEHNPPGNRCEFSSNEEQEERGG